MKRRQQQQQQQQHKGNTKRKETTNELNEQPTKDGRCELAVNMVVHWKSALLVGKERKKGRKKRTEHASVRRCLGGHIAGTLATWQQQHRRR